MKKSSGSDPADGTTGPDAPAADTGPSAFPNFERMRVPAVRPAEGIPAVAPASDLQGPFTQVPPPDPGAPLKPEPQHLQRISGVKATNDSGQPPPRRP